MATCRWRRPPGTLVSGQPRTTRAESDSGAAGRPPGKKKKRQQKTLTRKTDRNRAAAGEKTPEPKTTDACLPRGAIHDQSIQRGGVRVSCELQPCYRVCTLGLGSVRRGGRPSRCATASRDALRVTRRVPSFARTHALGHPLVHPTGLPPPATVSHPQRGGGQSWKAGARATGK